MHFTKGLSPTGRLGSVANIETGSMNLDENNPTGTYPFYTRNVGSFFANRYTNDCSGVIVAGEGNFNPKYVSGKFGLHQRAYLITPKTSIVSAEAIYEIIASNVPFLNSVAVGSTVKSLRRFCFEQMPYYEDLDYESMNRSIKPMFQAILSLKAQIVDLKSVKSNLLTKYF